MNYIRRWFLGFFDVNGDHRLTFADVSVLVAGVVFTLKMLGIVDGSESPELWMTYIISICAIAGLVKVTEVLKK